MRSYYKVFVLITAILVLTTIINAQQTIYSDSWGAQGFTLLEDDGNTISINYSITEFYLEDLDLDGEQLKSVKVPGIFLPNNEGAPDLAGTGRYVAIPQGAKVSYTIIASRIEKISNIDIAPAPRIPLDTDDGPLHYEKNSKIYSKNSYYPSENIILKNSKIRGVDVVMVGITPFQYNPVTKELIIYRDLQIELKVSGGNGHVGNNRLRSRWWDPIIYDAVLNPNSVPAMDYSVKPKSSKVDDYDYIIIVPNDPDFISWANQIKNWRNLQGINTCIAIIGTGLDINSNTVADIETYVDNAYNTWDPAPSAVLLLGDYGTGTSGITSQWYTHPAGYPDFVSDNKFADVNEDNLPDIAFARITANDASQLQVMITKFLDYESSPPTSADFYDHPITALGWQTERWFQICSEAVGGYFKNVQGKNPVRINEIYSGTPGTVWSTATNTSTVVNYFGPSGLGYIPATPAELGGWSGGNATDVINAINAGSFLLQHRDHGSYTGWGEPGFTSTNINSLTNINNKLPYIFSINCQTGAFHRSTECFAEKFHRHTSGGQNSGALGIMAATEVSYSFVNDTYMWGVMDNLYPDFMPAEATTFPVNYVMPAFGNAAGKHFLYQSGWPYNTGDKLITYRLFHHHGDAFMTVYSEVPQNLTVTHDAILLSGTTSFNVTANTGSFIALTVNGEIIGTADGTGSQVSITIPPQNSGDVMTVTVTKQNYYRYSSEVDVIPPTGPYVAYDSHTINDATGNGNGQADYGETIALNMTVENQGSVTAYNVNATLISSDSYITITDNSETFGTINSGATSTQNDAFTFTIADDIPDQYSINFELEINGNADDTWTSYFTIVVNAPVLETGSLTISDGNGKLDPGETVDILIETSNTGHSDSPIAIGTLASTSSYITINNSSYDFGAIVTGATEYAIFNISVSGATPPGTIVTFDYDVVAGNYSATDSYNEVIGQIPVLILDLDDNTSSGPAMGIAMTNLGVPYDYATSFPTDISLYSSVFVCLGIYSDNYVLSSTEGQNLANYLNNGGQLYMEGGDTWYYDSQTAVHSMFNLDGVADGTSDMGTVLGQAGSFTQGMTFSYTGENSWMDHINPIAPAVQIFMNQSPSYGCGVAYDDGAYKTIGTSYEFGGLTDGVSPSTKSELMYEYLKFFGLTGTSVNLTAFLEGPFVSTEMTTLLNVSGYLPLSQPYNVSPWNYSGGETVASIPNTDIVEWVLVELRETAGDASTATPATSIARKAGFILKDGSIVDTDGTSSLRFDITVSDNLFAVVYHRNHLGIMSAYPLSLIGDFYTYNFTTGMGQAYGDFNAHKEVVTGIWGMASGDADADGEVDNKDKNDIWKIQMGSTGYLNGDFDMNGQVEMIDKIAKWKPNTGNCSFIIE
jgi:hypothetical protein